MKRILILLFLFTLSCSTNKNANWSAFSSESAKSYYQDKLQKKTEEYINAGILDLSREAISSDELLTKANVENYSKQIVKYRFPKIKKNFIKDIYVNEDKTSKLWLVAIQLDAAFDNILYMIIG